MNKPPSREDQLRSRIEELEAMNLNQLGLISQRGDVIASLDNPASNSVHVIETRCWRIGLHNFPTLRKIFTQDNALTLLSMCHSNLNRDCAARTSKKSV